MLQLVHKAWRKLRGISESRVSGDFASEDVIPVAVNNDYTSRIARELKEYNDCEDVHDLPAIFHYWSNRYLLPKFAQFGISDPEQFFFLYAQKLSTRFPGQHVRMVSIGSGNCDMEIRLALRLRENGISAFTIECLDINRAMLQRGRELAVQSGVAEHIVPLEADFNFWRPEGIYDVVLANQCLHHVVELEKLFAAVRRSLNPEGYFLISDMIGRNGHQQWPEGLQLVNEFWKELPDTYRYNHELSRYELEFINFDCSQEGFEGIRSQDILPLLIEEDFKFELFLPFAGIVFPFITRAFGPNFDANAAWDREFVDKVHARDEEGLLSGELAPMQMLAVLRIVDVDTQSWHPQLTPARCVRKPD